MLIYHLICHKVFSNLQKGIGSYTSGKLRIWNEVATLFLVAIVFIIELKDSLNWVYGVVGFFSVAILLMLGIKIVQKVSVKIKEIHLIARCFKHSFLVMNKGLLCS